MDGCVNVWATCHPVTEAKKFGVTLANAGGLSYAARALTGKVTSMAYLFDTTPIRCQATAVASSIAAAAMFGSADVTGNGSALAMGCAP